MAGETPTMNEEKAILEELATYDNRKLMLWELAADGRSFCGVDFVAGEWGIHDAPVEEQVEAFVEDMLGDDGEIREEYNEITDWNVLEEKFGEEADKYL